MNSNPLKFRIKQLGAQTLAIAAILVFGLTAGLYLLLTPPGGGHSEQGNHAESGEKRSPGKDSGPHGGRLFREGDFSLELAIFEQGVPPEFRLYAYRAGKPLAPASLGVSVTLQRLGRPSQRFAFVPAGDHLKGQGEVEEPHSFAVRIEAQHEGRSYGFGYEQVEARVEMTQAQLEGSGITLAQAGPTHMRDSLQLMGEVLLNEDKTVRIVPRLGGIVETVKANAGDRVRKGQVLAVLSSQALADQRGEWLAASKRLALARTTHEREKNLWEAKISATQDFLQAQQVLQEAEITEQSARQKLASLGVGAAGTGGGNLTRYEILAPIDGVITDKAVAAGEVLKDDKLIFVVADMASVWVDTTVYAKDLNRVQVGQRVTIRASAFETEAVGHLSYVGAVVGEATRTAVARVVLPNPKGLWRPGLPVAVELVTEEAQVPLAVAVEAVQKLRERSVVFARYGEKFEARPIKTGRSDGRMVEVLEGLLPGEQYAARNSFLLKADLGKAGASHDH